MCDKELMWALKNGDLDAVKQYIAEGNPAQLKNPLRDQFQKDEPTTTSWGNSLQPKNTLRDYFQKTVATSTSLVHLESLRVLALLVVSQTSSLWLKQWSADATSKKTLAGLLIAKRATEGEDVNRLLEGGRRPLHYAADCGQNETVEYLLSKGAEINSEDKHGITPLLSACYEGHLKTVKLLLDRGADKSVKGPDGLSAFESTDNQQIKALLH